MFQTVCRLPLLLLLLLLVLVLLLTRCSQACQTLPGGVCYNGATTPYASYSDMTTSKCREDLQKNWCAINYSPTANSASFACANSFPSQLGVATCGDGPGAINNGGCRSVQTPQGMCYMCCCRGGNCNSPAIFQREVSKQLGQFQSTGQYPQSIQISPYAYYSSASQTTHLILLVVVFVSIL